MYHVMNRGDQREDIFKDDEDRKLFLATLGEACQKTDWQVHAYCLMRNHFHLLIETPQPNLVFGMKWLLGVYTKRFNMRAKLLKPATPLESFRWSSYGEYLKAGAQLPKWLRVDRLFGEKGIPQDSE